jgi:hypothetical protein
MKDEGRWLTPDFRLQSSGFWLFKTNHCNLMPLIYQSLQVRQDLRLTQRIGKAVIREIEDFHT